MIIPVPVNQESHAKKLSIDVKHASEAKFRSMVRDFSKKISDPRSGIGSTTQACPSLVSMLRATARRTGLDLFKIDDRIGANGIQSYQYSMIIFLSEQRIHLFVSSPQPKVFRKAPART
jgi:hypothetical protein